MLRRDHRANSPGIVAVLAAALALVLAACGAVSSPSASPFSSPEPTSPPAPSLAVRPQVVIDTDMSTDDTVALPFLLREPAIDVLAVTVVGTGLAHCGGGQQAVSNILATLGIDDIPVTCGRGEPLAGGHAFPAEWRAAADAGYDLALERRSVASSAQTAPELIGSVVASATGPLTIVALGPMTNLAEALQADATLASRIDRIVAMGGAVDVTGNVATDDTFTTMRPAEWNIYADPAAADIVFRSGVPITLVPLDATNSVPVDAAFFAALETDHAAAPADIAYELIARRGLVADEYLWDALASVVAVDESVVTFETIPLQVITAEGPDSGRTARAADGMPVTVAMTADRAAFEKRFLAGLRLGAPRPHPFALAGAINVSFDGTTCTEDVPATIPAGSWMVNAKTTTTAGWTYIAPLRLHEGATWDDLVNYESPADDPTAAPPFVDVVAGTYMEGVSSARQLVELTTGTYGFVCLHGTDPSGADSVGFPASSPFTVEAAP